MSFKSLPRVMQEDSERQDVDSDIPVELPKEYVSGDETEQKLDGEFDGLTFGLSGPGYIEQFVRPGESVDELLMRTILPDQDDARLISMILYRADRFGIESLRNLVKLYLAASCSVKGISRDQLLQAAVGQLHDGKGKGKDRTKEKDQDRFNENDRSLR